MLTVRSTPFDTLMPPIGSQILAKNVMKVISDLNPEYNEIVIHAFSIGLYIFGEVLNYSRNSLEENSIIMQLVKGIIMDSVMSTEDGPQGFSRVFASNPKIQILIEKSIRQFIAMFPEIILKNHDNSQQLVTEWPMKCPGYIKDNYKINGFG